MPPALRTLARRQSGVFSRAQALRTGMTAADIERRLLAGDWLCLESGVYVNAGTPMTHAAACWAAVLAVGPPVALARRSAAAVLRFDRAPGVEAAAPELVVPRPRRDDTLRGGGVVRRVVPSRFVVVRVDGLPLTPPAFTLRELAFVLPRDWARDMVQHAVRRRTVSYSGLARELGRGWPGAAALREILIEIAPGFQVVWEGRLHDALVQAGLDVEPQVTVPIGSGRHAVLDLAIPHLRLGIEVDGLANHLDRFRQDRERDRLLMLAGWVILHVAAGEVAEDLPDVVAQVVLAADRRARDLNLARRIGQRTLALSELPRQVRGGWGA